MRSSPALPRAARALAAAAVLLACASACGPSLVDLSRGMAAAHERELARAPVPDRQRTYYERDTSRPRTETEVLILSYGRTVKHGVERRWYPDGALELERGWRAGEPSGWWRAWYPDGTLRSEHRVDPEQATEMSWWRPDGSLSSRGPARDSLREGLWCGWHPDGAKAWEGGFRRGVRHGAWQAWRPDGTLLERGEYRDGLRVGAWERFGPSTEPATQLDQ